MLQACTQSYIAKHMEIKRDGNTLRFKFEHRTANIPLDRRFELTVQMEKVANVAVQQLFYQDVLGALLTLRLQGDPMRD